MIKSGYWTNKAPYRRIQTETLSYDPCLAIHVRWYTDAALCCGLLLLLQTLHSSNIVVILSCCLDAHVLLLLCHLQVWLSPTTGKRLGFWHPSVQDLRRILCVHTMEGHVP